jgi:hypothetical protein
MAFLLEWKDCKESKSVIYFLNFSMNAFMLMWWWPKVNVKHKFSLFTLSYNRKKKAWRSHHRFMIWLHHYSPCHCSPKYMSQKQIHS